MEYSNKISRLFIQSNDSILMTLKKMDKLAVKLLIIIDDGKLKGLVSIGDIQRAIIKNVKLDSNIISIIRGNFYYATINDNIEQIKRKMIIHRDEYMPIINSDRVLIDVIFWDDIFVEENKINQEKFDLPIVVMAGGKGSRLKPLTNVIPKPLIPIGEKTIIEEIMDRFIICGSNKFFFSVNYKAETIKHYFSQKGDTNYDIKYFQEENPLGTAGSLFLIKDMIKTTFFVSNCDIIIDEDYSEILKYHKTNNNELTIVSALKNYSIPYGTIKTGANGQLIELKEKPDLMFQINSGMYILEPHLLKEIPENEFYHITQLINQIVARKGKVGVFPVSQNSWKDIGEWSEYYKLISPQHMIKNYVDN